MGYKCVSCKGKIRKNYYFGVNSTATERGHSADCDKKALLKLIKKQNLAEKSYFKRKAYK